MTMQRIYDQFESLVAKLELQREKYVLHPQKDFSRHRKISFSDCIKSTVFMNGGTLFSELMEYFEGNIDMPSISAYVQQRSKIKVSAFEELFYQTTKLFENQYYHGYRLLAVDGTDIHIPTDPNDKGTYFKGVNGQKPYNMIHLNALYDIQTNSYVDAVIQDRMDFNEADAVNKMIDRSSIEKALIIADRGYESYNVMAHSQEKGWKYLIRIKDFTGNGISSRLDLPDQDEFDIDIDLKITRKISNQVKELIKDRNHYRYAPPNSKLDYLPANSNYKEDAVFYHLPFRILRFKISESQYEMIVTNLARDEFSSEDIKRMYTMRWGIETSFRSLKYHTGMLWFHSKNKMLVKQEIIAHLILFNLVSLAASSIDIDKNHCKYDYKINFAHAIRICKKLFLQRITSSYAETLILRSVVPIRNAREFNRRPSVRIATNFIYRIA